MDLIILRDISGYWLKLIFYKIKHHSTYLEQLGVNGQELKLKKIWGLTIMDGSRLADECTTRVIR